MIMNDKFDIKKEGEVNVPNIYHSESPPSIYEAQ